MEGYKRKIIESQNLTTAKLARLDETNFFQDFCVFLHPAALGATKRKIFERAITSHGGELSNSLGQFQTKKLVIVFDESINEDKLHGLVLKSKASLTTSNFIFVKSTWLTKCLERGSYSPLQDHQIKEPRTVVKSVSIQRSEASSLQTPPAKSSQALLATKFVCSQASHQSHSIKTNEAITSELQKLAETYKSLNDRWRSLGYEKAISAIKRYPKPITTREEAASIPGVGRKMADKIIEILESGRLEKVANVCESEKARTINLFNRVWGVGPASADGWFNQGCRSLEDLSTKATLNRQQKIGLKHFRDLDERMERLEASKIEAFVRTSASKLQEGLEVIACGSYRRGKSTCGDLDILITHTEKRALDGFFDRLLEKLRAENFLTDDLTIQRDGNQQKYLGVCKLPDSESKHRRLDIIVVPYSERAPALLYFTGSAHFNRSMRLLASKMGMSLSEHSLNTGVVRNRKEKMNSGTRLHTPTEESIFEFLNLPYREPHERDH